MHYKTVRFVDFYSCCSYNTSDLKRQENLIFEKYFASSYDAIHGPWIDLQNVDHVRGWTNSFCKIFKLQYFFNESPR